MDTTRDPQTTPGPRLGNYTIDTTCSSLTFRSRHFFGLLPVRGTFAIRGGTVAVAEPLAESGVGVEVDAASFTTGNDQRDTDVRSARFLNTAQFPVITFVASHVDVDRISGTITACGTQRPATLEIVDSDVSPDAFSVRATTRIDRTQFGVTAARGMAARHLDLTLDVTFVRN